MPEACNCPYHQEIQYSPEVPLSAASQRNINIVTEPSGQRNMPPTPKLGYASGEVGEIEIPHQIDTE